MGAHRSSLLFCLPGLLFVACGGGDASIVVLGNVAASASCEYSNEASAPMIPVGYLDLAFERPYVAHVLVENTGSDAVVVDGGWRNVWREPSHGEIITGRGDPARDGLVLHSVEVAGGARKVVEVDILGPARIRLRRDFEDQVAAGVAPLDWDTSTVITFEGDAGGDVIRSEPWTYGVTVGLGRLVDAPAEADSLGIPGQDCCLDVASNSCTPGQDDHRGSCSECAACWPEVCNFSQNPSCGGTRTPGCGT
ncbi:MAG: hypothetical protein HY996_00460 [Micrococcales bacterium]|nr:hypothetical protein [Micrococcales bacterium]